MNEQIQNISKNHIQSFLLEKCFMVKNVIILKTFEIENYYLKIPKNNMCNDHLLCTKLKCINLTTECCAKKHNNHFSKGITFDRQGTMIITPVKYNLYSKCKNIGNMTKYQSETTSENYNRNTFGNYNRNTSNNIYHQNSNNFYFKKRKIPLFDSIENSNENKNSQIKNKI